MVCENSWEVIPSNKWYREKGCNILLVLKDNMLLSNSSNLRYVRREGSDTYMVQLSLCFIEVHFGGVLFPITGFMCCPCKIYELFFHRHIILSSVNSQREYKLFSSMFPWCSRCKSLGANSLVMLIFFPRKLLGVYV